MTQAAFSYVAYPKMVSLSNISISSNVNGLVDGWARSVRSERGLVVPLASFMSFWDRFRRKRRGDESEAEERAEERGQKKRRSGGWGGFRSAGRIGSSAGTPGLSEGARPGIFGGSKGSAGKIGGSTSAGSAPSGAGSAGHSHHGGIGGFGRGGGGSVGG